MGCNVKRLDTDYTEYHQNRQKNNISRASAVDHNDGNDVCIQGHLGFLVSVLPPYLTQSVCLSVTEKNCDTIRWLCAGGKHTATCDRVAI